MKNNVSFDDLAMFLAVVREGGFRSAARRLGVAASKVSTTISGIEVELGVPLLMRTTRSVRVTEAGQALLDRISPLLAGLDEACLETASLAGRVQGRLKLNVPGAVMPDILPALLSDFHRLYPDVEVEIIVENSLVDIVAAGCDAGIRYGTSLEQDMISVPVGPRSQPSALAASCEYIEARGMPLTPEELTSHDAIRYRLHNGPLMPWTLQNGHRTIRIEPITRLTLGVNALNTGLQYARNGIGIIGTFRNWLEEDFRSGTLVPILPDWWSVRDGPRLYYPSRFTSAALRAFVDVCRAADQHT